MVRGLQIRPMCPEDIQALGAAFAAQGWEKPEAVLEAYYQEQQSGKRQVFVAWDGAEAAGYVTLQAQAQEGPFAHKGIPNIADFIVFERFQRRGIGSLLMDAAEAAAKEVAPCVTLGVGLHAGYGSAQRMYVKRGYVPDGSGVWYRDKALEPYADCNNGDDLILYFLKEFP